LTHLASLSYLLMASVEIHVTSLSGALTQLSVDLACTGSDIKARLQSELGFSSCSQQLLAGSIELEDDKPVSMLEQPQAGVDRGPLLLTLIQSHLQAEDLELLQDRKDGTCGETYYIIRVRHKRTGSYCEHAYWCDHPMAGPIRPDCVTSLKVEEIDSGLVVYFEWSENSFDLASPGAVFRRPIALKDGKLVWAGRCTSEKKVAPACLWLLQRGYPG